MSQTSTRWVAAAVGALLLAVAAAGAAARESDEGAAYAIGAVFGSVVGALLLGLFLRFLYVRLARRDGPVVDWPWVLLTAGVIAILLMAARAEREHDEGIEEARDCRESAGSPFVPLGHGLRYAPLDSGRRRLLEEALPAEVRELYEGRLVMEGRTLAGAVFTAAIGTDASDRRDFEAGFTDRARERGGAPAADTVRGRPVTVATFDGQTTVLGYTECYGIAAMSGDRASAKLIAAPLLSR